MNRILFTAINFLIVIGIVIFLVSPEFKKLQELNSKIDIKSTEIKTQENYFKNLETLQNELNNFPNEVSKVNSGLPDAISLSSLISFLEKASSSSGLILKNIDFGQFSALQENPRIHFLPISLETGGSYLGFKNFLSKLEKSTRLVEIGNISFSYLLEEKRGGYNFKFGLKVYSY